MSADRRQRGFTLVELIVATTATVLVTGATVGMLRALTGTQRRAAGAIETQHQARIAMRAIVTAIRNVHRNGDEPLLLGADAVLDDEAIPLDWPSDVEYPADRLKVFTVTRRQVRPGLPESDVVECEFFLASARPGAKPLLMQRVDPTRNRPPDGGGVVTMLAEDVVALDLSYHDGLDWRDAWGERPGGLPAAVRIRLVVSPDGRPDDAVALMRIVTFPHRGGHDSASTEDEP